MGMLYSRIFSSIALCLATSFPALAEKVKICRSALIEDLEAGHKSDDIFFTVNRGLESYNTEFGSFELPGSFSLDPNMQNILLRDLRQLKRNSVWFDGGCGDGNAMKEYIEDEDGQAQLHAASYIVSPELRKLKTKNSKQITLHKGIFTDIPVEKLPRADVITDLYGIFAYTKDGDPNEQSSTANVMQRYIDMLKVGGVLYVGGCENVKMNVFKKVGRKKYKMTYFEWLASLNVPGISVLPNAYGGARIVKTSESVQLPRVRQFSYEQRRPPAIVLEPL